MRRSFQLPTLSWWRALLCCLAVLANGAALSAASARATPYLPPPGTVFAGVGPGDPAFYERQTLSHPAVVEDYVAWYGSYVWLLARADANHARAMLALMPNVAAHDYITTAQIMQGKGDAWLIGLGQALALRGRPTYIRPMAEMNGWWNPYAGFGKGGKRRRENSPFDFRQAWRRIVIILRGGSLARVNRSLLLLGMPPVRTALSTLPQAPVAFVWNPQTAGNPDTRANSPQAYYPGDAYTDWVGTDFFSKFPNWSGLNRFYSSGYAHKPFAFGEWGIWGRDDPNWTKRFFTWIRTHRRVRMVVYYQDYPPSWPFELARFRKARAVIRTDLRSRLFMPFPQDWMPSGTSN